MFVNNSEKNVMGNQTYYLSIEKLAVALYDTEWHMIDRKQREDLQMIIIMAQHLRDLSESSDDNKSESKSDFKSLYNKRPFSDACSISTWALANIKYIRYDKETVVFRVPDLFFLTKWNYIFWHHQNFFMV